MTIIYRCDVCGQEFKNQKKCRVCEASHMGNIDRTKYLLMINCQEICDYCEHSYYVYGIDRNCEHKDCTYANNYADFIPTEPLHNKSIYGV